MDYQLWHGDCLEEMDRIESGSVDAIFADPPYPYIKRDYGYWTEAEWLPMMKEVVRQSRRILKPHGSAVFVLQPNSEKVGKMRPWLWKFMAWCCEEWNVIQDAYWWNFTALPTVGNIEGLLRSSIKPCVWLGPPDCYRARDRVLIENSLTLQMEKAVQTSNRILKRLNGKVVDKNQITRHSLANGGATPYNVLPFSIYAANNGHGATTPVELADWWLRYISKPGDTVLDMFSGTATTGVAALPLGRSYIGIERLEKYHLIAEQRLAPIAADLRGELTHLPMFSEAVAV